MTESFPVKAVTNIHQWVCFTWGGQDYVRFTGILVPSPPRNDEAPPHPRYCTLRGGVSDVELIRQIYDKKIGELGTHWSRSTPIEFKYAKIKIGDVIDYYTTSDGIFEIPLWASFKYAVDEYMEEAPHVKFHPSRVRAFIEQNGVDRLDDME